MSDEPVQPHPNQMGLFGGPSPFYQETLTEPQVIQDPANVSSYSDDNEEVYHRLDRTLTLLEQGQVGQAIQDLYDLRDDFYDKLR